jgi:predicted glycogen debranching enzyme
MTYCWEQRRGLTPVDNHFSPGHFTVELSPDASVTVTLSTLPSSPADADAVVATPPEEAPYVLAQDPPEIQQLYRTAHSFLVQRASIDRTHLSHGRTIIAGYHWFGDWGRDTMIALPGLCLSTRRYDDAAEILRTFAAARRRGLLPNLFLDSGAGEAYNAVDASLWYIYALDRYYQATGDRALVEELRPALEEIIHYYRTGTDFGICMDSDGLINATAPGWQLTWMDAKVGDWVVTPRMGKPVEINALWYNALRMMERFAHEFSWPGDFGELAEQVRKSYRAFWFTAGGYLYDVLGDAPDARLRPNQIFAVSLPYSPLDSNQARAVVNTVERYLLTPYGLRTLAPHDPEYQGRYSGDVWQRDGAYHRGTVWAWLMGPYVEAYLRLHGYTDGAKSVCRALLKPLLAHVREAGVGSISEIFDGNPPHLPRGTISQAWSVAEVLRAWELCRP